MISPLIGAFYFPNFRLTFLLHPPKYTLNSQQIKAEKLMKNANGYSRKLEEAAAGITAYTFQLERERAELKRAIRVLAGTMALDEEGGTTMVLTEAEADYIKKVCNEHNVFHTDGMNNNLMDQFKGTNNE